MTVLHGAGDGTFPNEDPSTPLASSRRLPAIGDPRRQRHPRFLPAVARAGHRHRDRAPAGRGRAREPKGKYATGGSAAALGSPSATSNGDGIPDLVVSERAELHGERDALAWAAAHFAWSGKQYPSGPHPYGVALADLNGDGLLDVAVVNQFEGARERAREPQGAGVLAAPRRVRRGRIPLSQLPRVDLNGDSPLRFRRRQRLREPRERALQPGRGVFLAAAESHEVLLQPAGRSPSATWNGDGTPPTSRSPSPERRPCACSTTRVPRRSPRTPGLHRPCSARGGSPSAILNGDGKLDAAVVNYGGQTVTVMENRGCVP